MSSVSRGWTFFKATGIAIEPLVTRDFLQDAYVDLTYGNDVPWTARGFIGANVRFTRSQGDSKILADHYEVVVSKNFLDIFTPKLSWEYIFSFRLKPPLLRYKMEPCKVVWMYGQLHPLTTGTLLHQLGWDAEPPAEPDKYPQLLRLTVSFFLTTFLVFPPT